MPISRQKTSPTKQQTPTFSCVNSSNTAPQPPVIAREKLAAEHSAPATQEITKESQNILRASSHDQASSKTQRHPRTSRIHATHAVRTISHEDLHKLNVRRAARVQKLFLLLQNKRDVANVEHVSRCLHCCRPALRRVRHLHITLHIFIAIEGRTCTADFSHAFAAADTE